MTPKKRTYKKKQEQVQEVQSARKLRLPPWYFAAMARADAPRPIVTAWVGTSVTVHDLPEHVQRRIRRKLGEVQRLMYEGLSRPTRRRGNGSTR